MHVVVAIVNPLKVLNCTHEMLVYDVHRLSQPHQIRTRNYIPRRKIKTLMEIKDIKIHISDVLTQISLDNGERLYKSLLKIFNSVEINISNAKSNRLLKIAVKTTNDTNWEIELVPSRPVFSIVPRFPMTASDFPDQKKEFKPLHKHKWKCPQLVWSILSQQPFKKCSLIGVPYVSNWRLSPCTFGEPQ